MRVIERKHKETFSFEVRKSFFWEGRVVTPPEIIEVKDGVDLWGAVQRSCLFPADLQDGQTFIALKSIILPGQTEKHECKPLDLISLKKEDALSLMIQRQIIPRDPGQWRPYRMELARSTQGQDLRKRDQLADAQKERVMQEFIAENANLPSQKKKK